MPTKMISYVSYHGEDVRYVQYANDPVPKWAIDIREHIDERNIADMYRNRGLTDEMVDRVYSVAYERGHSSGIEEVNSIFRDLMYDLFKMSFNITDKANFG